MKRLLTLACAALAVPALSLATTVQFTTQTWTVTAGSGVEFNGSDTSNDGNLDLGTTGVNLFTTHNQGAGGLANGLVLDTNGASVPNPWEFFKLGTITLNESGIVNSPANSNETNNLTPLIVSFGLCVGGTATGTGCTGGANSTIQITADSFTASTSGNGHISLDFPDYPQALITFANGAQLEAILYTCNPGAGVTPTCGNDFTLDAGTNPRDSQDLYVKLWLQKDPDTIITNAVPEPASMALMGSGLIGLGLFARRRRAAKR